jgi:hypothetical protein
MSSDNVQLWLWTLDFQYRFSCPLRFLFSHLSKRCEGTSSNLVREDPDVWSMRYLMTFKSYTKCFLPCLRYIKVIKDDKNGNG